MKMRQKRYREQLVALVDAATRTAIEEIAYKNRSSISEATRDLLHESLRAKGIEC